MDRTHHQRGNQPVTETTKPVCSFRVEKTERHYLVGNAPALRSKFRKFPIVPDQIVVYLRNGLVSFVSAKGPSIRRCGEFGARHTFIVDRDDRLASGPVPDWIEELITAEGLQWEPCRG